MAFSRADLIRLLDILLMRLNELGIEGTFQIVGGAAIALKYAERPPTKDIDAEFISINTSQGEVRNVIEEIALAEGITLDWLNDYAKVFVPKHGSDDWIEFRQTGEIKLVVASAPLLLAMKLRATRGVRDTEDIFALLSVCEIKTFDEVSAIYSQYNGYEPLTDKAISLINMFLDG